MMIEKINKKSKQKRLRASFGASFLFITGSYKNNPVAIFDNNSYPWLFPNTIGSLYDNCQLTKFLFPLYLNSHGNHPFWDILSPIAAERLDYITVCDKENNNLLDPEYYELIENDNNLSLPVLYYIRSKTNSQSLNPFIISRLVGDDITRDNVYNILKENSSFNFENGLMPFKPC